MGKLDMVKKALANFYTQSLQPAYVDSTCADFGLCKHNVWLLKQLTFLQLYASLPIFARRLRLCREFGVAAGAAPTDSRTVAQRPDAAVRHEPGQNLHIDDLEKPGGRGGWRHGQCASVAVDLPTSASIHPLLPLLAMLTCWPCLLPAPPQFMFFVAAIGGSTLLFAVIAMMATAPPPGCTGDCL